MTLRPLAAAVLLLLGTWAAAGRSGRGGGNNRPRPAPAPGNPPQGGGGGPPQANFSPVMVSPAPSPPVFNAGGPTGPVPDPNAPTFNPHPPAAVEPTTAPPRDEDREPARAREPGREPSRQVGREAERDLDAKPKEAETPATSAEPLAPMSLPDARLNFETVVHAHAARCGLRLCVETDPPPDRAKTVRLESIERESFAKVDGERYRGTAVFVNGKGARVKGVVTVDFSQVPWSVEELSLEKPAAKSKNPKPSPDR